MQNMRQINLPVDLINPPNEYSVMPFWFWNDRLDEAEIIRQIADFEQHGVHGFVIHPRVGLPRDLGWMSESLLAFYEIAIKEARRRNMTVMLYDEAMYPSGSSCGQVVAQNSNFHCRCLVKIEHIDEKPYELKEDETLVAVVRCDNGKSASVVDRKTNSSIRGIHYIGDGPEEDTPPAADILNPDAVDCFIDLVYQKFATRFSAYLGNTIIGIFTDEPSMLGRCHDKHVFPSTRNILKQVNAVLGYDFTPHLGALWSNNETEANKYRAIYKAACSTLLEKSYYSRLSTFCRKNGLQLAGHPSAADDIGALRHFDIPGQDLVWRRILPDNASALDYRESTQAKCSSSAMIHSRQRKNLNECCGAYGHELTWDQMVWLSNWCIVRGVNLLVPHAFFYSTRGCRRDERPPALGPNAKWWPKYAEYADTFKRLSWINTDSTHVCHVAILGKANELPWKAARMCFENQIDFNYIEERHLCESAIVTNDGIQLADMDYKMLITELDEAPETEEAIMILESANRVIRYTDDADQTQLLNAINNHIPHDIISLSHHSDLRVRHVIKNNLHYYMLFNETQSTFNINIELSEPRLINLFNPSTGQSQPCNAEEPIHFASHEMKILIIKI